MENTQNLLSHSPSTSKVNRKLGLNSAGNYTRKYPEALAERSANSIIFLELMCVTPIRLVPVRCKNTTQPEELQKRLLWAKDIFEKLKNGCLKEGLRPSRDEYEADVLPHLHPEVRAISKSKDLVFLRRMHQFALQINPRIPKSPEDIFLRGALCVGHCDYSPTWDVRTKYAVIIPGIPAPGPPGGP